MPNTFFSFKQFTVEQDKCAMKVCTDSCLFGAFAASMLNGDIKRILDIGAGTGLLSLMLAQRSEADIEAVEIEKEAALQTAGNFQASPWADRLKITMGDIRNFSPANTYDLIITNPPFYEGDLRAETETANHARHDTGLTLTDLIKSINRLLDKEEGVVAILLPAHRAEECLMKIHEEALYVHEIMDVRQTPSHRPFRSMMLMRRTKSNKISRKEITIKNEMDSYSPEFSELLKDYYLNL